MTTRRFDDHLALTVLGAIYLTLSVAVAMIVGAALGVQTGVLALLLAMIVGLTLMGLTATVTMAVLDLRRAAVTS